MSFYNDIKNVEPSQGDGHIGYSLLGAENGCVAGCCAGVSVYSKNAYNKPGIHDDQEGFYVLEGKGYAKVGDEEIRIEEGVSFIVKKGVAHSIKKDKDQKHVKVFWFHSKV